MVVELQQDLTSVLQISEAQFNRVMLFTLGTLQIRQCDRAQGNRMAILAPVTN